MYRQGDILLVPIAPLADRQIKRIRENGILAYGEATGHKHKIRDEDQENVMVVEAEDGSDFLEAIIVRNQSAEIVHEDADGNEAEHLPIEVPPGTYQVVHQREADPLSATSWRKVVD